MSKPIKHYSKSDTFMRIENAAHDGAFGLNSWPTPTDGQCAAGNYKVGKTRIYGLPIAIEQPRHSYRTGIDSKTGKRWLTRLAAHYGYIQKTRGADGDPVDCFIGYFPQSEYAWVINQFVDGKFDEHKIMLCCLDESVARQTYIDSYEKGWNGLHSIVKVTPLQLRWWLKNGNLKRPLYTKHLPVPETNTGEFYQRFIEHKDAEIQRLTKILERTRQENMELISMVKAQGLTG